MHFKFLKSHQLNNFIIKVYVMNKIQNTFLYKLVHFFKHI
jgi:hypothetical protein